MADLMPLTLTNSILPLVFLIGLCIALPALLARRTLSQRRLALAVGATVLAVWGAGAAIMAMLYAQVNQAAAEGAWPYLLRSGHLALLWAPVLALVWFTRAQGVERRKGLLMGGGHAAAD